MNIDFVYIHHPAFVQAELSFNQELGKLDQIAEIISQGVRRHVALITQMIDVFLNQVFHDSTRHCKNNTRVKKTKSSLRSRLDYLVDRGVSIGALGHRSVKLRLLGSLVMSLHLFLILRSTTLICRPAQGTGPLSATGEARCSVCFFLTPEPSLGLYSPACHREKQLLA